MNKKLSEILKGIGCGIATMLFMIGLLPWDLVSKIIACIIAMLAILRIRKMQGNGEPVAAFTVSYVAVVIVVMIILNLVLPGASAA